MSGMRRSGLRSIPTTPSGWVSCRHEEPVRRTVSGPYDPAISRSARVEAEDFSCTTDDPTRLIEPDRTACQVPITISVRRGQS
jgi:hypothetical protein